MTHKAQRGLFELKQGRILCVADDPGSARALVAAIEALSPDRLEQLRSVGPTLRLVLTRHRAHALGITRDVGEADLSIGIGADETPDTLMALAMERSAALPGFPLGFDPRTATATESAGLALARFAHLLPALLSVEVDAESPVLERWIEDGTILEVTCEEVERTVAS